MDKAGQQLLAHLGVDDNLIGRVKSALVSLDNDETTLVLRLSVDENGKELTGFLQKFEKFKMVEVNESKEKINYLVNSG